MDSETAIQKYREITPSSAEVLRACLERRQRLLVKPPLKLPLDFFGRRVLHDGPITNRLRWLPTIRSAEQKRQSVFRIWQE